MIEVHSTCFNAVVKWSSCTMETGGESWLLMGLCKRSEHDILLEWHCPMLLLPLLTFDHSVSVYTSVWCWTNPSGVCGQNFNWTFSPKKVFFCPLPTQINSKRCILLEYGGFQGLSIFKDIRPLIFDSFVPFSDKRRFNMCTFLWINKRTCSKLDGQCTPALTIHISDSIFLVVYMPQWLPLLLTTMPQS